MTKKIRKKVVESQISDTSNSATTINLNTKIAEFENKIPGTSGLLFFTEKLEKLRMRYKMLVVYWG